MTTDFHYWSQLKQKLNAESKNKFFYEREIWFCSLGKNIGREQDGKNKLYERPVLILKKFNSDTFWALPLTTKHKNSPHHYPINLESKYSALILSQIRMLDKHRLQRKIIKIPHSEFQEIIKRIKSLL